MSCGLLGQHLGHSYSPLIHKMFADYTYNLFEIQPDRLDEFMRCEHFSGINVTIPYKKAVIPYCNNLTDAARSVGAVNTVVRNSDGNLVGHNTDLFGFSSMLMRTGITVAGKKALVLGSGGASVTVCAVLRSFGANVTVISRKGPDNYTNLYNHYDATLIVNTTPVGMFPNTDNSPLDLQPFSNLEGVLDLIYNPARTKLLQQAESLGLIAENGLFMLVAQAKESAEWLMNN